MLPRHIIIIIIVMIIMSILIMYVYIYIYIYIHIITNLAYIICGQVVNTTMLQL